MKRFFRLLVIAVLSCLLASTLLLAACKKNITITLDAGNGTIAETTYTVNRRENLFEFLKDKQPMPSDERLTFDGWYNEDNTPVAEGDVVPKKDITLKAKYNVAFTANLYFKTSNGSYPTEPRVVNSAAHFGEAFTLDLSKYSPATLDGAGKNRTTSDSLGYDEVFTAYLVSEIFVVNYNVNLSGVYASIASDSVVRGVLTELADGKEFNIGDNYRFAGWATQSDGQVVYKKGDKLDTADYSRNVTLYAKWETALTDAFGGEDRLFISSTETGTVYLQRVGLGEKSGSYNANTGVFSFVEGNDTMLEGKVNGNKFYYFEKLIGQTATSDSDSDETIKFNGGNNVSYTSAKGTVDGTFDMDVLTGEYILRSGESAIFNFTLGTVTNSDGTVGLRYYVVNSDERGFYSYSDSNGQNLLYFDGMVDENGVGGAKLYNVTDGEPVAAYSLFYQEWTDSEILNSGEYRDYYKEFGVTTYALMNSNGEVLFLVRTANGSQTDVDGVSVRGSYEVSDGYNGNFFGNVLEDVPDLLLDGFGNLLKRDDSGNFTIKGTYEIETQQLPMIESGIYSNGSDSWIKVVMAGESQPKYIAVFYNLVLQHMEISRPHMDEWANPAEKVYGGAPQFDHVWLYFSAYNGVYVLGESVDKTYGKYYTSIDIGTVSKNDDKTYTYQSTYYTDETSNSWKFRYKADGTVETTLTGWQQFITEGLEIQVDEWGNLTYKGKTYEFSEWSENLEYVDSYDGTFFLEFYHLGNETVLVHCTVTTVNNEEEGTLTSTVHRKTVKIENPYFDLQWKQYYGQDNHFDSIYLMDDNRAAIAVPWSSGGYRFALIGTVAEINGEYTFKADEDKHEMYMEIFDDEQLVAAYSSFTYKVTEKDGTKYAQRCIEKTTYTAKDGATLAVDGYGGATYTPKDGGAVEGTYEAMDHYGKYLLEFTSSDGTRHIFSLLYKDNQFDDFLVDSPEAGVYYYLYDTGKVYLDTYMVLLGDSSNGDGTVIYGDTVGTYRKTDKQFEYQWASGPKWQEYSLTLNTTSDKGDPIVVQQNIIVGSLEFASNGQNVTYSCFVEQMAPQANRNFEVEQNGKVVGRVVGDGYNDSYYYDGSTYYYGVIGIGRIKDDSPLQIDYDWDDDFENGKQLILKASYQSDGSGYVVSSQNFLFDIDGSKLSLRDSYNGTYAFYDKGNITQGRMYLDGHGKATIYDDKGNKTAEGAYSYNESLDCMLFTSEKQNFRFSLATMDFSDEYWFVYFIDGNEQVLIADDWSVLVLGNIRDDDTYGFINALYVDSRGNVNGGFASQLTNDLVRLETSGGSFKYFDVTNGKFSVNREEFIIRGDTLVGYQGSSYVGDLIIPDEVKVIGSNAFANVWVLGGGNYTLYLNNVERIEDYAFYGVHEFAFNKIISSKVLYVGNFAFYSPYTYHNSLTEDIPFSWISQVYLPNATYIGDYAFNGCNQLNNGTVTLNKVTYIGYSAFSHNAFTSSKMILDLSNADVTKIKMDDNAFLEGPNTIPVNGLPVTIYVRNEEAKTYAEEHWHEKIAKCVIVHRTSLEGNAYFDFDSKNFLYFGAINSEGEGKLEYYTHQSATNGYTANKDYGTYSFDDDGNITLTVSGKVIEFELYQPTVELDEKTLYAAEVTHTFQVTDGDKRKVDFTFAFQVQVENDLQTGSDVSLSVLRARYDEHNAYNITADLVDFTCKLTIEADNTIYNISVNMNDWTSEVIPYGITVEDASGRFRATLEHPLTDGYWVLTLQKKGADNEYATVISDSRRTDVNKWQFTVSGGNTETEYIVVYDPDTEKITVTETTYTSVTLTTDDGNFKVTLTYNDNGELQKLITLQKLESDSWKTLYSVKTMNFGMTVQNTDTNVITVRQETVNGIITWVITFNTDGKQSVTVTENVLTAVKLESEHKNDSTTHEDYFSVILYVDSDGKIVGLGEMKGFKWSSANNFYGDSTMAFTPQNVQQGGDGSGTVTFTFTHEQLTYTVTAQKTADGYKVKVQTSPTNS